MLKSCPSIGDLETALEGLPTGVHDMYNTTMKRIEDSEYSQKAKLALTWLTHALDSLTMDDLRHAIAVDQETHQFNPKLLIDGSILLSLCCGLITFEPESNQVRLVRESNF